MKDVIQILSFLKNIILQLSNVALKGIIQGWGLT